MVRVLIADDHPVFRFGLRTLLKADPAMEVVETLLQVLPVFLPRFSIDSWGGITLERVVCLPQTVHTEVVE